MLWTMSWSTRTLQATESPINLELVGLDYFKQESRNQLEIGLEFK
jgi:hypothetical protein